MSLLSRVSTAGEGAEVGRYRVEEASGRSTLLHLPGFKESDERTYLGIFPGILRDNKNVNVVVVAADVTNFEVTIIGVILAVICILFVPIILFAIFWWSYLWSERQGCENIRCKKR